jgi:ABC-type branched-subunit amino acid transport system substrate-binding protein
MLPTLAALLLTACGEAEESEPIRVGVLYSTTGSGAVYGVPALLGHELMVERINAGGGLLGRQVETIHRDDRSEPNDATAQARELITRYDVDFIIGGVTSAVGQAISEVARTEQVIYLAPMSKTTQLTDSANFHPYVFRVAANTNTEGKSAAILMDRLGIDNICTLLLDYSYGQSLDESFSAHIRELRPQVQIVYQGRPPLGETDYTTYITNILNSGCQGVFSGLWGQHFPTFAKQAQTFGFFDRVQYVSAGEIGSPEISEELGPDMPAVWGTSYEVFYCPDTPEHEAYVAEVAGRVGRRYTPSFPITGYVAMQFLAEAIRAAGTTETEAVRQALEGLTIMTPIGEQTMRASDHQANRGQFWGQMNPSSDPDYPYKVMSPVEYIPADGIMD